MKAEDIVGKYVKDSDNRYKNDIGLVIEERTFPKKGTKYMVVEFRGDAIHGNGEFRNYSSSKFGTFRRFKILKDRDVPEEIK